MIIVILIAISLTIALLFLGLFLWSIRSGQYNDTYTPSVRILFENGRKKTGQSEIPKDTGQETLARTSASRPDKSQKSTKS